MLIDTRNIHADLPQDPGTVVVERNRWRGFYVDNNVFVLYERQRTNGVALFIEPVNSDYTAEELGGRFMEEGRAQTVLTGGTINNRRDPVSYAHIDWAVDLKFIDKSQSTILLRLLAVGFNDADLIDFRSAKVTYRNEPFLDIPTITDLIRRYIKRTQ